MPIVLTLLIENLLYNVGITCHVSPIWHILFVYPKDPIETKYVNDAMNWGDRENNLEYYRSFCKSSKLDDLLIWDYQFEIVAKWRWKNIDFNFIAMVFN